MKSSQSWLALLVCGLIMTQAYMAEAQKEAKVKSKDDEGKFGERLVDTVKAKIEDMVNNVIPTAEKQDDRDLALDVIKGFQPEGIPVRKGKDLPTEDSAGRIVKSFTIKGNQMEANNSSEEVHSRSKRATSPGAGIPTEFEFTVEALSPFDTTSNFKLGSHIPYKLTIWANIEETDLQVEIFSELNGGPYFMISNVRFGNIGSNFPTLTSSSIEPRYESKFNDGRWDYALVDLGTILNNQNDVTNAVASKIEILFDAQSLPHDALTAGSTYRISVGALYGSQAHVSVAQDDLTYTAYTPNTGVDATFSLEGPDAMTIGTTAVYTITAHIHDLFADVALDVMAPLYTPNAMSIDSIRIASVGENWKYSVAPNDLGNFTIKEYEGTYGAAARLSLGTIINAGYHVSNPNSDLTDNKITFEVAVTMLNHVFNTSSPYTIGFTVWKKDMDSIEIMWSAQQTVTPNSDALPALATSPAFKLIPSASTVKTGGTFGLQVNMTLPASSSAYYQLEVKGASNNSAPLMNIASARIARVGYAMPHFSKNLPDSATQTYESIDNSANNDYVLWDLGLISNTGKGTTDDDSTIQIEIVINLLDSVSSYYTAADDVPIVVGVKHAETYYWVGTTSILFTTGDITYDTDQVADFSFTNAMGEEGNIYKESASVFDLDMVIPAGVNYPTLTVEINTKYGITDNKARLKILSMKIIHEGKSIVYTIDETNSLGKTGYANDNDVTTAAPVYNSGHMILLNVANVRDQQSTAYYWDDATIRIRTVVIMRGESGIEPADQSVHWVEATASVGTDYIYAARYSLTYQTTIYDFYTNDIWKPLLSYKVSDNYQDSIRPGGAVKYNVTVSVPYRTSAKVYIKAYSGNNIQMCDLREISRGPAVLDYTPSIYAGVVPNPTTGYKTEQTSDFPMYSSFGYDFWYNQYSMATYITYELLVNLKDTTSLGSDYTFSLDTNVGSQTKTHTVTISADDVDTPYAAQNILPDISLVHSVGSNVINIFGSEWVELKIYVPPGTQDDYTINIYAPYDSASYGNIELVQAHLISVGENLPCFVYDGSKLTVGKSTDNTSDMKNLATYDIGNLINVANLGGSTVEDANLVKIMALVRIPKASQAAVNDVVTVSATVDINGQNIWAGSRDLTVVAASDTSNESPGDPTLTITAQQDTSYYVGETQTYTAKLTVPPGVALSQFKVIFETPAASDDSEALAIVSAATITAAGQHMTVAQTYGSLSITDITDSANQVKAQVVDFGFLRNSNASYLSHYLDTVAGEDELTITFKLRLLDAAELGSGKTFNMMTRIEYGSTPTSVAATGSMTITVEANDNDRPQITFTPTFVNLPAQADITQDTAVQFNVALQIEESSRRFPESVSLNFRVPYYSVLVSNSIGYSGESSFVEPTAVADTGLQFTWTKLRFGDTAHLNFSITLDPNRQMVKGLGERVISMPIDITYKMPDKNGADHSVNKDYFTEMKNLQFKVTIPDCQDALGVEDSNKIKDCQITASTDDGVGTPAKGRLNSDGGWVTRPRGPPLYQNEYIQVDMGTLVKFTGVSIQPHTDGSTVNSFKVKWSREGLKWEDALDYTFKPATFSVSWSANPPPATEIKFISFGTLTFRGRYIRIIPQTGSDASYSMKMRFEVHGCLADGGSTLPSVTCPTEPSGLLPYNERQILFIPLSDVMFACMIPEPGSLPFCSGATSKGTKWFAVDDNVLNMLGYDTSSSYLYALGRDRKNILRSKDMGHRWYIIDKAEYDAVASSLTAAKAVPFPLDTNADYTEDSADSATWAASKQAVHNYPSGSAQAETDNHVAYWGNKAWNGP